ncbi:rab11 family-interacting protein 1-like, partial [Python bivittatus]|uniref:Rab11 family-interacting protein 1-like n=1 Tax=Python bivittatus TaxID=176946 RepID=A0A9F2WHX7_PYTBI
WYRLHSKPGRKEKERGEIQLTIEFTRHSLTASMFDLSVKDKPRSPFRKLKDKVKGRQKYDLESASAIVSSSSGALDEDFDLGGRKDKAKGFFFKRQLRRSSLTRSSTSLGSESTVSSASSLAGLGSTETVAASPGRHSSLSTDPAGRDFLPSPKPSHKRAFSDEVSQISVWPEPQSVQSLQTPKEPSSRSSLCINGSHIYCEEPSHKPSFVSLAPLPPSQGDPSKQDRGSAAGLPAAEPDLPPWPAGGFQKGPPKDPPRFIPSPPILAAQEEDKLSVKTIALNKHRVRVKMEEGLQAESKPVSMAAAPVFPSEVRRVRPQEERERAEAGVFHRENGKGRGQSHEAGSPEPASSLEATAAGEEGPGSAGGGGGQIGLRDSREPVRKLSSQPGLPAPPELAKDPCVSADEGLPPSVREPRAQPLTPTASHLEPLPAAAAAPAHPSVEGDDGFDAFAASRLQPAAPGEPPEPSPTADSPGLPGGAAGLSTQQEGEPPGPFRVPRESPDRPHFVFGDRGRASSGSEGALLARETFGEGGSSPPEASGLQEERAQGEAAHARIAGQPGSSEQMAAVASAVPEEALGWAISPLADPFTEEQDRPAPRSQEQALPGSQPTPEADSGDASWLWWDPEREEEALGLRAEDATPTSRGPAEEERRMPAQTKVPGGAEPPPPEFPRRVSPLGLTEEASGAGWGTPERARPGGPGVEAHQHLPPVGAAGSPPATTASLAPAAIIGAGVRGAAEGRGPAAAGDEALEDNELASQEASSGDTLLAVNEGAGGAEHFTTCPSQPSVGGLGLSDATESPRQGGPQEPGSGPQRLECAWPPGLPGSASLRSLERLPRGALEPSPSLLFWSTLEEQRGLPGGSASLKEPEEQLSGPEQDDAAAGPAPCLPPLLEQSGHRDSAGHELELSPGAPSDPAMDFKKASFWQAGKGEPGSEHNDLVPTPGNPFASWAAPSLQNNPFVDVPADMPWAQAAILQVSPIIDAQGLGEFPAAAGPPGDLHSHRFSQEPPVAPSRPGPQPLAFSTPSVQAALSPADLDLPSPLGHLAAEGAAAVDGLAVAPRFPVLSPPGMDASAPSVLSTETPPAEDAPLQQTASPHPVKPMRSTPGPESLCKEKPRQAASWNPIQTAGQEQLTPNPASSGSSAASVVQLGKKESKQTPPAKYHHLTREELVQLVLRREAELGKKEEQVRELENYIDRLLVRIMEQSPILLQIPLGEEAEATQ